MTISIDRAIEKLIWLLTVFLLFAFVAYNEPAWGKYAVLAVCFLIAMLAIYLDQGRIRLHIETYHFFLLLFALFALASSLWALYAPDAVERAWTLLQILICFAMAYLYYQRGENIQLLLTAVIWAGYLLTLYTISIYGISGLISAAEGKRLTQSYNNSNTIGMAIAFSCLLQANEILCKRYKWTAILIIPAILVVVATQSRKALLLLGVGIFLLYFIKNLQNKANLNRLIKFIFVVVIAVILLRFLLKLSIFNGIRERLFNMFAGLKENELGDHSTKERLFMTRLGWDIFKENPILGVGIGNAHIIVAQRIGRDTYLHNNFVELLSSGGIVGFSIYYAMYGYLFSNLIKYRNANKEYFQIGVAWLAVMLIFDYGWVSYYDKTQWFYLMIQFLNVRFLQRESERNK